MGKSFFNVSNRSQKFEIHTIAIDQKTIDIQEKIMEKRLLSIVVGISFLAAASFVYAEGLTLSSPDLAGQLSNQQIFNEFGCSGENISPQLNWKNAPAVTAINLDTAMMSSTIASGRIMDDSLLSIRTFSSPSKGGQVQLLKLECMNMCS